MKSFGHIDTARLWLARYRTPLMIGATALGAITLGFFFEPPPKDYPWLKWASFAVFVASQVLAVFLSIAPRYYERIEYARTLLPAICDTLGVDKTTRVAIHHIRSAKAQTYEQLTPYFPTNTGQGRRFVFTQGITGQAFRTRRSHVYSIPKDTSLKEDYHTRWAFTDDEVGRLTQDRRSFYAYPVGQEGSFAKALLYFDSADPETFSQARKAELDDKLARLFLPTLERLLGMDAPQQQL